MIGKSLLTFPALSEGVLLKRYKRFLADVELDTGEIVTAHCANTGPMTGVLKPGGRIRIRYAPSPSRKLSWSWEQAQVVNQDENPIWVGVNTALPNKIVRLAIESGCFREELGECAQIRNEVKYGKNGKSRIDLLLTPVEDQVDQRQIFVEIKNTTWTNGSLALFPDTVTERGQKHLQEMIDIIPNSRAILVPCISRNDVELFAPGDAADPRYGNLFRKAVSAGVEVMPCCFGFFIDHITWEGMRPFRETQAIIPSL